MWFVEGVRFPWNWSKYQREVIHPIACVGDPDVAPTRHWWDIHLGIQSRWKTVAILKAKSSTEIYIGFVAHDGTKRICKVPVPAGTAFGMLIGHEPVSFFAVALVQGQWQPVELELVARVKRNDRQYKRVPLY